jgi:hypothetical protein
VVGLNPPASVHHLPGLPKNFINKLDPPPAALCRYFTPGQHHARRWALGMKTEVQAPEQYPV